MSGTVLRIDERTDFLGTYVAYTYTDGHVETDPPDRPVYKEDYQRQRSVELAQQNTSAAIAAARLARTTGKAGLNREQAAASATADLLDNMRQTLQTLGTLIQASVTPEGIRDTLVSSVDMGGPLIGAFETTTQLEENADAPETVRELR